MDPPRGHARLMGHGVVCQPRVLVCQSEVSVVRTEETHHMCFSLAAHADPSLVSEM